MKIAIVIPAFNEEKFLEQCLDSLVKQSLIPEVLVLVDDNSTDKTPEIMKAYSEKFDWIEYLSISSDSKHSPGAKVVQAFNMGLEKIHKSYDIICKFDADLIFPENYLERVAKFFKDDHAVGIAGGLPFIKSGDKWEFEAIASKDHVRGPLKAYRQACFQDIGGLKASIGWDSVDVLLAQYHGWRVKTDKKLHVKHLKPTGSKYNPDSRYLQGEAFYKLGFSKSLAWIASLKGAINRRNLNFFFDSLKGFNQAKKSGVERLVNEDQAKFVRKLRWRNIRKKLFFQS